MIHYKDEVIYATGNGNTANSGICFSEQAQQIAIEKMTNILPFEKDGYVYTLGNVTETKTRYQLCRQKK